MALAARSVLQVKAWPHGLLGRVAYRVAIWRGTSRIVGLFSQELVRRIPLPWDHQLVMVARGLQITGIVTCLLNERPLETCDCFVDLVLTEGKEKLEALANRAAGDWSRLGEVSVQT